MRFQAASLIEFAARALCAVGLDEEMARTTARILVEGDLLGHSTHGLALLPGYVESLETGTMRKSGEPTLVNARPASELWDGHKLPGPWLVDRAITRGIALAKTCGTSAISIRNSHHIACLAAYLEAPARDGFIVQILSSDPAVKAVAPHGGRVAMMTPNPLAIAWPTRSEPVIVDVSMSVTAMGLTRRLFEAKQPIPEGWAIDAAGHPTTDAGAIWNEPKGALLPLGSDIAGHKGYSLGLMVEALTSGLSGDGRATAKSGWGANVLVQVWDVSAFSGMEALTTETEAVRLACVNNPPRPGVERVRMPGERGLAQKAQCAADGVLLHSSIPPRLQSLADRLKIQFA